MLKRIHLSALIFLFPFFAGGQASRSDTVINLDPVTISASRIKVFAIGQALVVADSLDRAQTAHASVGELVSAMAAVHVKNYGDGTLSTVSMRGTSANHTGIIWNGIRVSPPNIGYVDLSMVRSGFFDEVSLLYGGASPLFGSGFIGGSIHLAPQHLTWEDKATLSLGGSYGSFGYTDLRANAVVSNRKVSSRTSAFYNGSNNDFPYESMAGNREKQAHGGFSRTGACQELAFNLGSGNSLNTAAWFQYADRNIPPTLTEAVSEANQVDRSVRVMSHWKHSRPSYQLDFKVAYFNDFIRFTDPRFQVHSVIATQTATAQYESSWQVFRFTKLYAGTGYTYDLASLSAYDGDKDEHSLALFASVLQTVPSIAWKFVLHMRQELFTFYNYPFTFGMSAEGGIAGPVSMQLSISRNFRAPTLNERYWTPGGNPSLDPEKSWNVDASLVFSKTAGRSEIKISATGFSSFVKDWILWVPGEFFWSARNEREVWARGVEVAGEQAINVHAIQLAFSESYSYTISTNENEIPGGDQAYKKQLIYIPVHKGILKASAGWKGFGLTIRSTMTGKVYTSRDNSSSLPGYILLDLVASKRWEVKDRLPLVVSLNANNILDEEYQVTPYRPMAGFNLLINLNIILNFNTE